MEEKNKAIQSQITDLKKYYDQQIEWMKITEALKMEKETMEKNYIKENCEMR
jgi:hypothetical protein